MLRHVDLVRIAVLLLALPVVVILRMAVIALHVTVRREASPQRAFAGDTVTVTVSLTNHGRRRTPTLLVEDGMPAGLDVGTRVVAPPLPGGATARLAYTMVPPGRGRYVLGPARVHAVEPFGLLERTWRAAGTDDLIVRPRPIPLDGMVRPARRGGDSEAARSGVAAAGAMDMTVREYRDGDDLRRVHWPTTARRGQLMVRRDERPEELRLAVMIDTRAEAYGSPEHLDWVVTAAASVAARATDEGHAVSLVGDGVAGAALTGSDNASADLNLDDMLDRLAIVEAGPPSILAETVEHVDATNASGVVAFLGNVTPSQAAVVAGSARTARRHAFVVGDAASAEATARILNSEGWIAVVCTPGTAFAAAWNAAIRQGAL